MASWTPAPPGSALFVPAGSAVAVVASVKSSHSQGDLLAFAVTRGLEVTDYAEQGSRAGLGPDPRGPAYRYVAATATASRDVSLPWEVPWPASMFDDSQLVSAWTAPPGNAPPAPPTPPAPGPARPALGPALWPLFILVGGAAWSWWRGRKKR